jgi:hypothetical protein
MGGRGVAPPSLASTEDGAEWSASGSDSFTTGGKPLVPRLSGPLCRAEH